MAKALDLIGKHFNMITVVKKCDYKDEKNNKVLWLCRCDCPKHTEFILNTQQITKEIPYSCGCTRRPKSNVRYDLEGQVFGKLTVKEYVGKGKWRCVCSCNGKNEKIISGDTLRKGKAKSCGKCIPSYKDIKGWQFGSLVAVEYVGTNADNRAIWDFVCLKCGNHTEAVWHDLMRHPDVDHVCKNCLANGYIRIGGSSAENEIKDYISSLTPKRPKKARVLGSKEIDMLYEDDSFGIEYNGSVYHASKGAIHGANKPKYYHRDKFLCAKEKGIHLLNIFDVDWESNKERIKMYLRSIFLQQFKIMARKCSVHRIDKSVADEFTDKYHLQGRTPNSHMSYGLYYKDLLVAVMSFDWVAYKNHVEGNYELHRYCVKDGYIVVGGANKLLKAFERDYNPKYLLSYSDNDYFLGDIYERLGFECKGQCTPRYYWYLKNTGISQSKTRLEFLSEEEPMLYRLAYAVNAPNKEDFIMRHLGACKIYRSGRTKWEKRYENNIS